VVSMNFWAFPHRIFAELATGWERFLATHRDDVRSEYLLPSVVHDLRADGEITVGVVPTHEPWVGVTNPDDLEVARRLIAEVRS